MDACYGCGSKSDANYIVEIEIAGRKLRRPPRAFAYQSTSLGEITFCDVCFEESRFRGLTSDDVEALSWHFGSMQAETEPARAVKLLEPLLEKWRRSADVLSPLGHAYIALGDESKGRSLLVEALQSEPNHPNAARDRSMLAAV